MATGTTIPGTSNGTSNGTSATQPVRSPNVPVKAQPADDTSNANVQMLRFYRLNGGNQKLRIKKEVGSLTHTHAFSIMPETWDGAGINGAAKLGSKVSVTGTIDVFDGSGGVELDGEKAVEAVAHLRRAATGQDIDLGDDA
jgi:hypothetical protein